MKLRFAAVAVAATALAAAPSALAKGTVYSTGNSNELQSKAILAGGALGPASVVPTGAVTPRGIAITPNGLYLYMTSAGSNVLGFDIRTATPTQVSGSPYNVTDTGGYGLAISPSGGFLYTLNQNGGAGSVSIFAINSNGSLTKVGANAALGYQGDGIAISPSGSSLYITDTTNNTVHSYAIAADGTISQTGTAQATDVNPKGIAVGPAGLHVYTSTNGGTIRSFPVGADGTLSANTSSVSTGLSPQTLAVTQNGRFLYTADFNTPGRISAYAIGADGSLTGVPGQPFAATAFPYGIDAAPGGQAVYSASFDAAVDVPMDGYSIGADGALTALTGSPFPTQIFGSEFQSVVVSPNQGPTALFTATAPGGAGQPTLFDASSSSDPDGGTVAVYDWDFGDGTTLPNGGPTPTHTYAQPGNYNVTLTVTDDEGCSTTRLFTGQTVDCNPGVPPATSTQALQVSGTSGGPDLELTGKKQKLKKTVTVKAETANDTDAVATGKLKIENSKNKKVALKSYSLKKFKAVLTAGEKGKLKPKLPSKGFKKAKKALKKGGKVTAKVNVKVTDANSDTEKEGIKVKLTK